MAEKTYYDVHDVTEALGVSESKAYGVIKQLNNELKAKGYVVILGKVNKTYFMERCCYGGGQSV